METAICVIEYLKDRGFVCDGLGENKFKVHKHGKESCLFLEARGTFVYGCVHPIDLHDPNSLQRIAEFIQMLLGDDMNCPICHREIPEDCVEKHHLVPKSRKGRSTVRVCTNCGDQLHKLFTNKELEKKYNTLEALLATEKVQKWAQWIGKKKDFSIPKKSFKRM